MRRDSYQSLEGVVAACGLVDERYVQSGYVTGCVLRDGIQPAEDE